MPTYKQLKEKFYDFFSNDPDRPLFINPGTRDWKEIETEFEINGVDYKMARFVTDPDGNIYAWDASKIIHPEVVDHMRGKNRGDIQHRPSGRAFYNPRKSEFFIRGRDELDTEGLLDKIDKMKDNNPLLTHVDDTEYTGF